MSLGQLGDRHIITTPIVSTSVFIASRTVTPTPIKHIVRVPNVAESLSQMTLVSIRESPASSFVLPSQRPAKPSANSWCEVCRAVRNLKPSTILGPIARSAISWAEHWYGTRTAPYVQLVPPSPSPPPPPSPPPTATTPETPPGTKTTCCLTPAAAAPGIRTSPTRASNSGLDYRPSSSTYIAMSFASMVVLCTLVVLRTFYQDMCSNLPITPIPTPVLTSPSSPASQDQPDLPLTPVPSLALTPPPSFMFQDQPVTPAHPRPAIQICVLTCALLLFLPGLVLACRRLPLKFNPQSLPSPPAVDLYTTPRPPWALPIRPFASKRRPLRVASYDTCLGLFKWYTRMNVIQTDTTAYHVVPGLGRRVVFETSTESFVPDFKMLAEAEQRVADVVKSAQNMVRTMYAELDGGTIEVDVRVVLEGLVVDEDEDGDKSVSGKDRHVYRPCFVVELPPLPTTFEPASQPVAPMGLLSPVDIVSSSVAGSVQYWPPIDFTPQSPELATPKANSAYLLMHSELAPQPQVDVS
ncbi:hypothetical protein FRC11_009110, partial [Ceratobasidium sp. 423]